MGERTNIFLVNDHIYLYAHWVSVEELRDILKNALIRGKERWNDKSYLNRIIFSELIKDEVLELTGYGLSSSPVDGSIILKVDVEEQKVNGKSFKEFIGE